MVRAMAPDVLNAFKGRGSFLTEQPLTIKGHVYEHCLGISKRFSGTHPSMMVHRDSCTQRSSNGGHKAKANCRICFDTTRPSLTRSQKLFRMVRQADN